MSPTNLDLSADQVYLQVSRTYHVTMMDKSLTPPRCLQLSAIPKVTVASLRQAGGGLSEAPFPLKKKVRKNMCNIKHTWSTSVRAPLKPFLSLSLY